MVKNQVDTSGVVLVRSDRYDRAPDYHGVRWRDLSPFVQGYTHRALEDLRAELDRQFERDCKTLGQGAEHAEVAYDTLAPETLARIIEECAEAAHPRATKRSGQNFWVMRRIGSFPSFPHLTIALNDAGKVVFQ